MGRHDEHRLDRFVACRRQGDERGMRRWWDELMVDALDRVEADVAIWGRGGRLSAAERDEAVSLALLKAWGNMLWTFRGTTMGEWVLALRRCTHFACLSVVREAAERGRRLGSLDEVRGDIDGDPVGRYDAGLARLARVEHEDAEQQRDREDFVGWALPRVREERRRTVLERTLDGVPAAEIADELGVTMGNLYQLRSRGTQDLAQLKEQWDA